MWPSIRLLNVSIYVLKNIYIYIKSWLYFLNLRRHSIFLFLSFFSQQDSWDGITNQWIIKMTLAIVNNDVVAFRIGDTNSRNWLHAQKKIWKETVNLNITYFYSGCDILLVFYALICNSSDDTWNWCWSLIIVLIIEYLICLLFCLILCNILLHRITDSVKIHWMCGVINRLLA
jgi:hypothetical protein